MCLSAISSKQSVVMVLTRFTPFLSHLSTDKSWRVSHVFMSGQLSILFSIISLFCIYICLIIHFDFSEVYPATTLGLGNNNFFPFSMETSDVISSCTVYDTKNKQVYLSWFVLSWDDLLMIKAGQIWGWELLTHQQLHLVHLARLKIWHSLLPLNCCSDASENVSW